MKDIKSSVVKPSKTIVFKKISLLTVILISTTLYTIWTAFQHVKMAHIEPLPNTSAPKSINDQKLLRIKENPKKNNDLPNVSKSISSDIKINSNTHSHEVLHGHKVKAQNSSIIKYGKIYGSHLKADSVELILGLAANTDAKSLAIFCGSIREVSGDIDVVLFVNKPVSSRHIEIAKRYDIVLHEYDVETLEPVFIQKYHPSSLRWILFDRLLHFEHDGEYLTKYRKVLFADVRDTVLQTNPFDLLPNLPTQSTRTKHNKNVDGVFYAFQEMGGLPIRDCGWNSGWIKDCFSEEVYNKVSSLSIICSGISLATIHEASLYTHTFSNILLGQQNEIKNKFPQCERNGVDQGIHNVLMHLKPFKNIQIKDEISFPVTHLQNSGFKSETNLMSVPAPLTGSSSSKPNHFYAVSKHNTLESKLSVVHQYDRWHAYQVSLAVRYVYWTDCSNENKVWQDESTCVAYTYAAGEDIFKGMCDLGSFRALTSSSCCTACELKNKCNAFAYVDGVCHLKGCSSDQFKRAINTYQNLILKSHAQIPKVSPAMMSAFKGF